MPYGVPTTSGGDSPANVGKMDRCVAHLVKQGHDKVTAIKICKASLFGDGEQKGK